MADDVKPLNIAINTTYDGGGAGKAAAELEQLTNSGKGLATAVPDLEEKTKAFVITTEAEYLAVQKAHEAVSAKIPVLEAAGKSTAEFRKAQENLSAALSTNEALLIAEKIENQAAAGAALENAAAQKILGEASAISTVSMRELTVIARELANGNFSRLPGSASILAGQFGLLKYVFSAAGAGIISVGVAAYFLYEHLNQVNAELDKTTEALEKQNLEEHAANVRRLADAWNDAQKEIGKYYAELATAGADKDPIKTQLDNVTKLRDAELEATKQKIEALGKEEVAYLRAHGATPEQIAAVEERTRRQGESIDAQKAANDGPEALAREQQMRSKNDARLQRESNAAIQKAADARLALEQHDAEMKEKSDFLDPAKDPAKERSKKREAANAELSSASQMITGFDAENNIDYTAMRAAAINAAQEKLDAVNHEEEAAKTRLAQLKSETFSLTEKAAQSETESKNAQNVSETNRGRLRQLPGEQAQTGKIATVNDQSRQFQDIISTRDQRTGETIGQMGAHIGQTNDQILKTVDKIINQQMTVQQVLAAYEARIRWMEQHLSQIKTNSDLH